MISMMIEGWLLGLSTGPYCLGACTPFMVPYLFAEGKPAWQGNLRIVGEFLLGRLIAYLVFGAVAGWMGEFLRPHITGKVTTLALGFTAFLMILYASVKGLPHWKGCPIFLRRLPIARMPLLLGILIGINVCPPFLVGMVRLLQVGGLASGAVFFLGFFWGTSLYTLPLLTLSPFTRSLRLQRIGTLSALLIGSWYLVILLLSY